MRIMARRNSTDSDMIEFWCRNGMQKLLMGVIHQDCLMDISHYEAPDDALEGGMMLELVGSTVSKEEAKFWGV